MFAKRASLQDVLQALQGLQRQLEHKPCQQPGEHAEQHQEGHVKGHAGAGEEVGHAQLGVCGALAHNAAQLCAAYFLTSTSVLFYVPFLLVFGVLTGLLTGLVLKLTLAPLERLQKYLGP